MASSQNTPGSTFAYILSNRMPDTVTWVRGDNGFHTQPSGNSGAQIACSVIQQM